MVLTVNEAKTVEARCDRRQMTTYLSPYSDVEDLAPQTQSHQACWHNVVDSVIRRHYKKDLPGITREGAYWMNRAFTRLKKLCRAQGLVPGSVKIWSPEKVVKTRAPAKRASYAKAFDVLREQGMGERAHHVKVFVKDEKGEVNVKPPRLIQYRAGMEFTAKLSQYLAPLEHKLYALLFHGSRIFAKQLGPKERAEFIAAAFYPDGRYRMLDHSAFDAHMSIAHLRYEHEFYLWLFQGDAELRSMLDKQLQNRCHSGAGVRWRTNGGRMSGDFNTALGNSIVNALVILAWAERLGILDDPNFKFQVDGDDSWCIYDRVAPDPKPDQFTDFGMTTKIEGLGDIPEHVGFCQSRPVRLSDGWMMCRDYRRVLTRLPHTIQRYTGVAWDNYARGVAECELALGRGVPVLDAIARSLYRDFGDGKIIRPKAEEFAYMRAMKSIANRELCDDARISYGLAWGIMPDEQVVLEGLISRHIWRYS